MLANQAFHLLIDIVDGTFFIYKNSSGPVVKRAAPRGTQPR